MKALVICESIHNGNTKKVADAMAGVLGAEVKKPGEVDVAGLGDYGLIGFGSGVYAMGLHKSLLKLADRLPPMKARAFIFSTSGYGTNNGLFHRRLKAKLAEKGLTVVGEFMCKGSYGSMLNKGKPDENDLENARRFAAGLASPQ